MLRKQETAENTANVAVEEQGDGRNAVGKRTGRDGNSSGIALTTRHTIARDKRRPGAVGTKRRQRHHPLKGCHSWMDEVHNHYFQNQQLLHIVKDVVVAKLFPSIRPVIHPWMASYREENPSRNK
jgi:hypothetical protein